VTNGVDVGTEILKLRSLVEVDVAERRARDQAAIEGHENVVRAIRDQGKTMLAIIRWLVIGMIALTAPDSLRLIEHLLGRG
jgi:hypothetical protein